MSTALGYPDACPECPPPFDRPACLPDRNGVYRCSCGLHWTTLRDEHGWPVERQALAEQNRERRSAA